MLRFLPASAAGSVLPLLPNTHALRAGSPFAAGTSCLLLALVKLKADARVFFLAIRASLLKCARGQCGTFFLAAPMNAKSTRRCASSDIPVFTIKEMI